MSLDMVWFFGGVIIGGFILPLIAWNIYWKLNGM